MTVLNIRKYMVFIGTSVATLIILIGFQNCGDVRVSSIVQEDSSVSCVPESLGISTDNSSSQNVRFFVRDFKDLSEVADQDFSWSFFENSTELFSSVGSDLNILKSDLLRCRTYKVSASFRDCDQEVKLTTEYTLDGPDCASTPIETTTTTTLPEYPPANPAPPGQQTVGLGCQNGYQDNPNFDYAHAKYCVAESNSTAELLRCRRSGFDFTSTNSSYFPVVKSGQYLAVEFSVPQPFTNGISKSLCGVSAFAEMANPCGGAGQGGVDTWTISPNPGDFNVMDPRCIAHTSTAIIVGQVTPTPEMGGCPLDPGRRYYLNIKMGNCSNPIGCAFLLSLSGIFSGKSYMINGLRYTTDLACQLRPDP